MLKKSKSSISNVFEHYLVKIVTVKDIKNYNKLINWVIGDFDLYLRNESSGLTVYFPCGQFSINKLDLENDEIQLEIKVDGRSMTNCQRMMDHLEIIYNHVISRYNQNISLKHDNPCR